MSLMDHILYIHIMEYFHTIHANIVTKTNTNLSIIHRNRERQREREGDNHNENKSHRHIKIHDVIAKG